MFSLTGRWLPLGASPREWLEDALARHQQLEAPAIGRPRANLWESVDGYVVQIEMPGLCPLDVEVHATASGLKVACERPAIDPREDASVRRQERWQGRWTREMTFSTFIDPDSVEADLGHGLLIITARKAKTPKPRKVAVTDRGEEAREPSDAVPSTGRSRSGPMPTAQGAK